MTNGSEKSDMWGTFRVGSAAWSRWRIGSLTLWVYRTETEWRLATLRGMDPLEDARSYAPNAAEPPEDAERFRFAAGESGDAIRLNPALADRPVVVRPEQPLTLLPGDEAVFYVGSQLWVHVEAGMPPRELTDVPTLRLSDTWFGTSTREGEACYASKSNARTGLGDVPIRPARALTRVRLVNRGADKLRLERLKIPVSHLALFMGSDGRCWTQSLVVERGNEGTEVTVRIESSAPEEAGHVERIADPRVSTPGVFKRALGALIG